MASRSYFVGPRLTIADLALWERLFSSRQWDAVKDSPPFYHLKRWDELFQRDPRFVDIVTEATVKGKRPCSHAKSNAATQDKHKGKQVGGSFDIDLEGASNGNVVTRFPPEPSGYLHIGHAKAALLNQYFARHYNGKLIIRFDDTNPSKEKDELYKRTYLPISRITPELEAVVSARMTGSKESRSGAKLSPKHLSKARMTGAFER